MSAEPEAAALQLQRIATRVRRLKQQIRAFRDLHVAEVSDVAEKLSAIAQLHATELQLILDELADVARELTPERPEVKSGDPAAASPKRAKWQAEEERRRSPVSRRELLRGRGEDKP